MIYAEMRVCKQLTAAEAGVKSVVFMGILHFSARIVTGRV